MKPSNGINNEVATELIINNNSKDEKSITAKSREEEIAELEGEVHLYLNVFTAISDAKLCFPGCVVHRETPSSAPVAHVRGRPTVLQPSSGARGKCS